VPSDIDRFSASRSKVMRERKSGIDLHQKSNRSLAAAKAIETVLRTGMEQ